MTERQQRNRMGRSSVMSNAETQPNSNAPALRNDKERREWIEAELDLCNQVGRGPAGLPPQCPAGPGLGPLLALQQALADSSARSRSRPCRSPVSVAFAHPRAHSTVLLLLCRLLLVKNNTNNTNNTHPGSD